MKKKICLILLCLVSVLACAFAFAACGSTTNEGGDNTNGGNEPEHTHEWSSVYIEEGDRHYQTCMGCKERKYGEHTYNSIGYCICGKTGPNAGGPNTGIENPPTHTHNFTVKSIYNEYLKERATCTTPNIYYYRCDSCNEHGEATFEHGDPDHTAHDFSAEVPEEKYLDYNATCQNGIIYHRSCSRCGESSYWDTFEYGEPVGHKFTREERYKLAERATCVSPAKYYYLCEWCSEYGEDTFEYGEPNPTAHDFSAEVPEQKYLKDIATCQSGAIYYCSCSYCGEPSDLSTFKYGGYGNHKFDYRDSDDCYIAEAATCIAPAKYYYRCDLCAEHGTETFEYGEIDKHAHDLELHEGYEAIICTEMSWDDYYTCRREGCDYNSKEEHSPNTDNPAIHNFDDGICLRCNELQTKGLLYNDEGVILGVSGDVEEVVIPSKINGINIKIIGDSAFRMCSNLANIIIPDSITAIGDSAFSSCNSLVNVVLPANVNSIGDSAFYNCSNLANITIPDSVTSIGRYAFEDCSALTAIEIPDSVTNIGYEAFYNCNNVKSATIPALAISAIQHCPIQSLVITGGNIEQKAFSGFGTLKEITIGNKIESIGDYAFYNCTSLTQVRFNAENCSDLGVRNYAFDGAGKDTTGVNIIIGNRVTRIPDNLFYTDKASNQINIISLTFEQESICNYIGASTFRNSSLESVLIPSSVLTIGEYSFYNTPIKSIQIPNKVKAICNSAFENCGQLAQVLIGNSVETIGDSTFRSCTDLTSILIPDSVISIGDYVFYNSGLLNVSIGSFVKNIGGWAFCATPLTSVIIPNSVTSIGTYVFSGCSSLKNITIGNKVETISDRAFNNCSALTGIEIPDSVTLIGESVFYNCSSLKNVTIGNKVETIGEQAFYNCASLTSIIIPDSVTSIGESVFYGCSSLSSVKIGNRVTAIGREVFYNCINLTSITIPNSVTAIASLAFYNCSSLKDIYYSGTAADWATISIGSDGNSDLTSAIRHYAN